MDSVVTRKGKPGDAEDFSRPAFIAVYPEFRGRGLGTNLLGVIEKEAKRIGSRRVALDVEISDEGAIKLYKRLGYDIKRKAPIFKIKDKNFELFNMSKNI